MNIRVLGLLFGLTIFSVGMAALIVTSSQALSPVPQVTPAYSKPFAVAEIAKPTYTPIPTATALPTFSPTEIPASVTDPVAGAMLVDPQAGSAAPVNYEGGKKILVDISEQHMYVYDGEQLVYSFVASTGLKNATRTGTFSVLDKIPSAYGATWNIWMPNWLGIYYAGSLENGIHALPILSNGSTLWDGYLGTPISFGCVVLGSSDAQTLYDWAELGVPVEIQW